MPEAKSFCGGGILFDNKACVSGAACLICFHLLDSLSIPRHGESSSELGSVMI
jgi:hypothetical protein